MSLSTPRRPGSGTSRLPGRKQPPRDGEAERVSASNSGDESEHVEGGLPPVDALANMSRPVWRRRHLLGAAAAAVAGLGWTAAEILPASAAGVPSTKKTDTFQPGLRPFEQEDLNFQTLFTFGEAAYGVAEAGELAAAVGLINTNIATAGPTKAPYYQQYVTGFRALAERTATSAAAEEKAGRFVSARARYLRAASYYANVLFFVLGSSDPNLEKATYAAMQRCWNTAAALLQPAFTRIEIEARVRFPAEPGSSSEPVSRTISIPAYWARADGGGKRPTVIVCNGSDAQLVDIYAFGGAAGLERGYNVLLFEGPGQGSLLFEQDIPFTPYWGDVITPIVDFVVSQPEADPAKVALTGWSFGGLLVLRAAAVEPRIAAVVSDPAYHDNLQPWQSLQQALVSNFKQVTNANWAKLVGSLPPTGVESKASLQYLVDKRGEIYGPTFHRQAVEGQIITDIVEFFAAINSYNADAALLGQIKAHTMLTSYQDDQFFGGQTKQVQQWLTNAASVEPITFTEAQGAAYHCGPMAPQTRNETVFDWLDQVLDNHYPSSGPAAGQPPSDPDSGGATSTNLLIGAAAAGGAVVGAGAVAIGATLNRRRANQSATAAP